MAVTDLTPREEEVAILLANGLSSRQVAARLGIAHQTAKNIEVEARKRLRVGNRYEMFMELGWLTPPVIKRRTNGQGR